jgi:DNA-binding LacI/PurR family transcriptional regulator
VNAALDAQLPLVAVAPDETLGEVAVLRADNIAAGRTLGAHLAELGHTRVAFAGCPSASVESRHRLQGLRDELGKHGIRIRKQDVCFCDSYDAEEGPPMRDVPAPADASHRRGARQRRLAIGFIRAAQRRASTSRAICRWRRSTAFRKGRGRGRA